MGIISFLIKTYIVILFFRKAMTRQELYFNPLGKMVAKVTDPLFEKTFKLTKKTADRLMIVFILLGAAINGALMSLIGGFDLIESMYYAVTDMMLFLMTFYIISVILGVFAGNIQMSYYAMYFNRIASTWIKVTRKVIPVKSNYVIIPTVLLVFVFFTLINGAVTLLAQYGSPMTSASASFYSAMLMSLKSALMSLGSLLTIYIWVIIIRALMSWLSPDPRNPIVQIIQSVTDPVMEPFRRIIPPLGPVDLSPMILILFLYFLKALLYRVIGILL